MESDKKFQVPLQSGNTGNCSNCNISLYTFTPKPLIHTKHQADTRTEVALRLGQTSDIIWQVAATSATQVGNTKSSSAKHRPVNPIMVGNPDENNTQAIRIYQQNLNKSRTAQFDLINSLDPSKWDFILIQEPFLDAYNNTKSTYHWHAIYPPTHFVNPKATRSIIFVNAKLNTNNWTQIQVQSGDVTGVRYDSGQESISIFNIYNDCGHNLATNTLTNHLQNIDRYDTNDHLSHMMWCGDFNRHHPLWDDMGNDQLFTRAALDAANVLIQAITEHGLEMTLPAALPTLRQMATGRWTRPDNVFCSAGLVDKVRECNTNPENRPTGTDHVPIYTIIDLPRVKTTESTRRNFRATDWEKFREQLTKEISMLGIPAPLADETALKEAVSSLDQVIQNTIKANVPLSRSFPFMKRWWNSDLTKQRQEKNRLNNLSFRFRHLPDHPAHQRLKEARKTYAEAILSAKEEHWTNWLEELEGEDIWKANKYISNPTGDGGRVRIPPLSVVSGEIQTTASTNDEKAKALAKSFFPPPPDNVEIPQCEYPEAADTVKPLTAEQILRNIKRLRPFKAPGPDGIPNAVLINCADLLIPHLQPIFQAVLDKGIYIDKWRVFDTVVLRKPGKPSYSVPKAYRPVALLNTIPKLLAAIIAEDISYMAEKFDLLPSTHFGGRPGRNTSDQLQYIVSIIKDAWKKGKVASVLYLDVAGAFPNAVKERLLHNLRRRRIPETYVVFVGNLLSDRSTRIKFDDYISDPIAIRNGIGQGDPLSMILYLFYNADLFEIPKRGSEWATGYVDDSAFIATAKTFAGAHRKLTDMMERRGGATDWSIDHNSPWELSKSVYCDYTRLRNRRTHQMKVNGVAIKKVDAHKQVGVYLDEQLRWKKQQNHALANAAAWVSAIGRFSRTSKGISYRKTRQLVQAVAIPRVTYCADVWYTPVHKKPNARIRSGSVAFTRKYASLQRIAGIAITGGLRSTPTDVLDLHAGMLPAELLLKKACIQAAIRWATLPEKHPLRPIINERHNDARGETTHVKPIQLLLNLLQIDPHKVEKLSDKQRKPTDELPFQTIIAKSREESHEMDNNATEEVKIYTDGSGIDGAIGAAAILARPGRATVKLRYRLGTTEEHTVYEGELVGIILALTIVKKETPTAITISISSDNQATVLALSSRNRGPAQYLVDKIISLIEELQANGEGRPKITVRWISGHDGSLGNELADEEAKKAAGGDNSEQDELPEILANGPLPLSVSAIKQTHKADLVKQWKDNWSKSTRFERLTAIDPKIADCSFVKLARGLPKPCASILTQLRTRHIPLNAHLHRIGKRDLPDCKYCVGVKETTHHYLLDCPRYANQRHTLRRKLGRKANSMTYLLSNPKATKHLIRFVDDTERLRETFGDLERIYKGMKEHEIGGRATSFERSVMTLNSERR